MPPAPTTKSGQIPLRTERFLVAMGDTDAARVIYFGAPFPWLERLSNSWLQSVGHGTWALLESGMGMPAAHSEADYHAPLRLDDEVEATLWLHHLGSRSLTFRGEFVRAADGVLAVVATITQVYVEVSPEGLRALAMPAGLAEALGPVVPPGRE